MIRLTLILNFSCIDGQMNFKNKKQLLLLVIIFHHKIVKVFQISCTVLLQSIHNFTILFLRILVLFYFSPSVFMTFLFQDPARIFCWCLTQRQSTKHKICYQFLHHNRPGRADVRYSFYYKIIQSSK